MKFIEKIKNKWLCGIVFKELEKKGLCVWKGGTADYQIGVTLSNEVNENYKILEKRALELEKEHKTNIKITPPVFSAGGVYASYLSVCYKR